MICDGSMYVEIDLGTSEVKRYLAESLVLCMQDVRAFVGVINDSIYGTECQRLGDRFLARCREGEVALLVEDGICA